MYKEIEKKYLEINVIEDTLQMIISNGTFFQDGMINTRSVIQIILRIIDKLYRWEIFKEKLFISYAICELDLICILIYMPSFWRV